MSMKRALLRRAAAAGLVSIAAACGGGGDDAGTGAVDARAASVEIPGAGTVELLASAGAIERAVAVATPAAAPAGVDYPVGFIAIDVGGLLAGEQVTVTLTLPAGTAPNAYVKCTTDTSCAEFPGAAIHDNVVTLTLVDGGAGDTDGAANGRIRDPGAPAIASAPADADHDGVGDASDNCPDLANADQADEDGDGIGNACDTLADNDGDGIANADDNCPATANADQVDADGDGTGDACDALIDSDGDGIANASDNCPTMANAGQGDADGDGAGDACDTDIDGDGAGNGADNCPTVANAGQADADGDGLGDACDGFADTDGDGVTDGSDNCPAVANPDQADADVDGAGDACDALTDTDRDGVADGQDNCPVVANADQADADGDGTGDACDALIDSDGDGVGNADDNCPAVPNPQQQDADGDGAGDACDLLTDSDDDGVADGADNCPAVANADQANYDNLGGGDACDTSASVQFFQSRVQPNLAQCRLCHVDGGPADTPEGNGFQLTRTAAQDLQRFYQAWQGFGRGSTGSRLLTKASNTTPAEAHAGLAPWPLASQAYVDARQLLACWDNPADCALVEESVDADGDGRFDLEDNCPLIANPGQEDADGNGTGDRCELLGSSRGGHAWFDFCEANAWQRELALPADPRSLVAKDNPDAAGNDVYFNSYWKDCHVDADNDTVPDRLDRYVSYAGPADKSLSTEKAHPKTCGDLQDNVRKGAVMMGAAPYDPTLRNADGKPIRRGSTFAADHGGDGTAAGVIPVAAYRELWRTWGTATTAPAPDVFDRMVAERYGLGVLTADNPYPRAGEDPKATNGGTGRLPTGLIQMLGSDGKYTGGIGINCQGCHGSSVAGAFHHGAGGAMLDLGTFGRDLEAVNAFVLQTQGGFVGVGAGLDRVGVAGRTRGTNNAQFSNVTALVGAFSTDSYGNGFNSMFFPLTGDPLFCAYPGFCDPDHANPDVATKLSGAATNGSTGSGDTPAWWNVGHRTVKFVDGLFPADAVRVDMALFFPLFNLTTPAFKFPNPNPSSNSNPFAIAEKFVGEYAQWVDNWLMALKAPAYPLPVDTTLAQAGAKLFHGLDLWSVPGRANPVPKAALGTAYNGNGSCASCHGAYSPAYVNDPAYLKDARLEGIAAFVVPIEAIDTDRVRLDTYDAGTNQAFSNQWIAYDETSFEKAGTQHGDLVRPAYQEKYDCSVQRPVNKRNNGGRLDAQYGRPEGYAAPPLYGVWATAPYFHNGSVPDVWGVLKSADRPRIWERRSNARPADFPADAVMGFDSSLGALDAARLGWKHEKLGCLSGRSIPVLECYPNATDNGAVADDQFDAVPSGQSILGVLYGGVLATWNLANPPILTNADVENRKIYNTAMHSQGNGGHQFTDVLTDEQRRAIIEYLKTL
jgi:hypothetical protein